MQFVGGDSQTWNVAQDGDVKLASGSDTEKTLRVRVSNSGGSWRSDCVILVFIERMAAAVQKHLKPMQPSPHEALIAFQRFRGIAPGDSTVHDFKLQFKSVFSAFRDGQGRVRPPPGTYALRIGHSMGESEARLSVFLH
jgi:hypothetical protein